MKLATLILATLLAAPAFAETAATSGAQSTAQASPNNIGNPIVNVNGAPGTPVTAARVDHNTNQAASPAAQFINAPSADVCARPGDAVAVGTAGLQVAATKGGTVYDRCDMRADAISLKVTGQPPEVIKARYCMDEKMAEAYARAGMACTDARPQQRAEAILNGQPDPAPVAVRPMPWQAGG